MIARLVIIVALVSAVAGAAPRRDSCGTERVSVKIGLDVAAREMDTTPVDSTIAALVALPRPRTPAGERAEAERRVWRVRATIVAVKAERDGDLHLVITDDDGHRMIIEIPSELCAEQSAWHEQVVAVRRAADEKLHPTSKVRRARLPAVITGVAFFDVPHGQFGVASNAIELHPVTRIEFGGGQ